MTRRGRSRAPYPYSGGCRATAGARSEPVAERLWVPVLMYGPRPTLAAVSPAAWARSLSQTPRPIDDLWSGSTFLLPALALPPPPRPGKAAG